MVHLAFSGAGFLGIYHIGVVSCLKFYARKLLDDVDIYCGSSAGALAACMLLCDMDLEESVQFVMHNASKVNSSMLGPMSPAFDPSATIRKTFLTYLPVNGYKIASGKLCISLTRVSDWKNEVVSEFKSNRELVDALVCSSFIPFFSGIAPPKFRAPASKGNVLLEKGMFQDIGVKLQHYIDGGFTDNMPQHFEGTTITVSPFCGESDICPDDGHKTNSHFDMRNTSIQITGHNIYRMTRALFPPDAETLAEMCRHGFTDTLKYLHNNYPEALDIGMDIISIPRCVDLSEIDGFQHEDNNDDDNKSTCSVCSCGSSHHTSFFNDMETVIAQKLAISNLIFPEQLNTILQKTKNIIHESDLCWYVLKVLLRITKWLARPYLYLSKHMHEFIQELFCYMLPKIKELSSYNSYMQRLHDFITEVYHAYKGTAKVEWHPSLKQDRCTDIERTNKRLLTATKSLVAMPRLSTSSSLPATSSNSNRLGHEAPPPSRNSSFVTRDNLVGFDMFASNIFVENEVEYDDEDDDDDDNNSDENEGGLKMKSNEETSGSKQSTSSPSIFQMLGEDMELLVKDDDGLVVTVDPVYPGSSEHTSDDMVGDSDDYGSDLDYKFLSSESFQLIEGEDEIQQEGWGGYYD